MRKFDTFAASFPDIYKLIKQDEVSKTYSFSKSYNHLLADDLIPQAEASKEQRKTDKVMLYRFGK